MEMWHAIDGTSELQRAGGFCWNISINTDQTVFILPTQELLQKWHNTPRLVLPDLEKIALGCCGRELLGVAPVDWKHELDLSHIYIYTLSCNHQILLLGYGYITWHFYFALRFLFRWSYVTCSRVRDKWWSGKFCFCIANPTSCTLRAAEAMTAILNY